MPATHRPATLGKAGTTSREAPMLYLAGFLTGIAATLCSIYAGLAWRLKTMWK